VCGRKGQWKERDNQICFAEWRSCFHNKIQKTRNQSRTGCRSSVTTKAKTKIKQVLNEEKTKAAAEGKEILMRRMKNWKIVYGDTLIQKLLNHYSLKTVRICIILFQPKAGTPSD